MVSCQPLYVCTAVGFLVWYFCQKKAKVSQTSFDENLVPSCQVTPSRSFQVMHIFGVCSLPPKVTFLHPEVLTSPLAVVGTSVARSGRQKSARVRALWVSSLERYQSSPSATGASTAYE